MKQRIFETVKMIAIGIWTSPPIELLTASVIVPVTIAGSLLFLRWVTPLLTMVGCGVGIVFGVTAIVRIVYLWQCDRRYRRVVRDSLRE